MQSRAEGSRKRWSEGKREGESEWLWRGKEINIYWGSARPQTFFLHYCTTALSMYYLIHMLSKPYEVDSIILFYDEETEVLIWEMSPNKVTQPVYGRSKIGWGLFDLKAWVFLPFSLSAIHLKSPSMFFHHKTHLGLCFVIKILIECECSLLAAGCNSMNYWTLELSHKS